MPTKTKVPGKAKMGRPTTYTPEIGIAFCELIASGKSLRTAVKEYNLDGKQFYKWLEANPEFSQQYTKATQDRTEAQFEELQSLAEEAMEKVESADDLRKINAYVAIFKMKGDNMRWVMSKMKPKKYGEHIEIDGIPPNPIQYVNEVPTGFDIKVPESN